MSKPVAVPLARTASVYQNRLALMRRLDESRALSEEPIPVTHRELTEFANEALVHMMTPVPVDFVIDAIKEGRFTLGGHPVIVI